MEWTSIIDCAYDASFTIAAEDSNVIAVNIQLKDFEGKDLNVPASVVAYLSNVSTGLTPHPISGEISLTSGGDGDVIVLLTLNCWLLISEADGDIDIDVNETGTDDLYLVLVMPNGKLVVSDVLDF